MITFEGNKQILKPAKLLESKARNTYPHISTYRLRKQIGYDLLNDPKFFSKMKKNYSSASKKIKESNDYYTAIISSLKNSKIGNCTEDAMLTELIGKINGQTNIYTGNIELAIDGERQGLLNHVIAFITDKPIYKNEKYFFKNKEAIIIDPWLGITDYVGNYFNKLKSTYRKTFMHERNKNFATFSNDNLAMELLRIDSKTPKEFKTKKKEFCPNTSLSIIPFINNYLNQDKINAIKANFPELVIKSFKRINLPQKAKFININVEY